MLLTAAPVSVFASAAVEIAVGTTRTGTLSAGEVAFFRIDPTVAGNLSVVVQAEGTSTRLSLLDAKNDVLVQSEARSPDDPANRIDVYVPSGTDVLEVEDLGGAGTFSLTSSLVPGTEPFQPVPVYPDGSYPLGAVEGDFNGDGHPDLAVSNLGSNNVLILLGRGDGTFTGQRTYPAGFEPGAITSGDFNGDGRVDLAVADYGGAGVSILLGNGDGSFQGPTTNPVGAHPEGLVAGDFNGDGHPDLAVANAGSDDVSILLGRGDGTFQGQVTYAVGAYPDALVAGDFDGDGGTDLAVANYQGASVSILQGNGDGTFRSEGTCPVGSEPASLAAGRFSGDGRTDLAVANTAENTVSILTGFTGGTFQNRSTIAVGYQPDTLATGDFNADGRDSLAIGYAVNGGVTILLDSPGGGFQDPITDTSAPTAAALVAGDFRGDGRTDVAAVALGQYENYVAILLGNNGGTFQDEVRYAVDSQPVAIASGDFNGDGRTDFAVADSADNRVTILLGNGDGTFRDQVTYEVGLDPVALVAGDFRGDGRTDLAVVNFFDNDVSILLGNGDGTFQNQVTYPVGAAPKAIVAADFNGDGRTDLAVVNSDDNDVSILIAGSRSDGTFGDGGRCAVGAFPVAIATGDFNNDGRPDLAVVDSGGVTGDVSVLLGDGTGAFEAHGTYAVGALPMAVTVADFNGDGRADLAVANAENDVSVLLGEGTGAFQPQTKYAIGFDPSAIVAADFNGDGHPDLAVAIVFDNDVAVLLGNGDGTFQYQVTYAVGNAPRALAAGDFNGDHRSDLAVVDQFTNDISLLVGNGDGTFQNQVTAAVGSKPVAMVSGDFNGDGHPDLAVANAGDNDVSILLGNGDGTFQAQATLAVGFNPDAIAAGDFNGDGRTDLAVTNLYDNDVSVLLGNGDGTFQHQVTYPVGSQPEAVVAGDFKGNGRADLAVVDIGAIDGDVTILLNQGDGTFKTQGTYPVGFYPGAIAAGDFNGDGRTDLAVTNRFDGTVSVLLADRGGDGTFQDQVKYAAGSGPVAIASRDLNGDGRLDLAVVDLGTSTGGVSVLLGDGTGAFRLEGTFDVGLSPSAITTDDFNGDGRVDLAVADAGDGDESILLGNGDGTFQRQRTYALSASPSAITSGDFNGDGRPDLAVANPTTHGVSVLLGNGQGFVSPGAYITNPKANPLVADLRGAGVDDAFVIDAAGDILWRQGTAQAGTFNPPVVINPGDPSRDLVAVDTASGMVLASLAAHDDAVSIYAWRIDRFVRIGTMPTGSLPAQIVAADVNSDGWDDLVVRNAGDGTLSIYMNAGSASGFRVEPGSVGEIQFLAQERIVIGLGVSDVAVTPLYVAGVPDLVVADKLTGEIGVSRNYGAGVFGPLRWLAAGTGFYVATANGDGTATITTAQATAGVAAGVFDAGRLPDLVAVNPGSNTFANLRRLNNGLIANPIVRPTPGPATVVRVADLNGDGIPDLAVLGAEGVSVAFGDGAGGFSPFQTVAVGSNPTGLTVAELNGHPDLLVGDSQGDVQVLLGDGKGGFQQPREIDKSVALAVAASVTGTGNGPAFFIASQPTDSIALQSALGAGATVQTLVDRANGVLNPGAVAVANLNDDATPYLVVANSGGNDVLVYPVLANGQLGPPLNNGFATGTDPVGITVANLNGRPDIVVTDRGSNDVTVLLNQRLPGGGFTFVEGPRLRAGLGPVATAVQDVDGDGVPDLLVSNSGSNSVSVLRGVGGGFFDDANATTVPVGVSPGPIVVVPNAAAPGGFEVVTANAGSNDLSVLVESGGGGLVVRQTLPSGGEAPLTAVGLTVGGQEGLLVGNNADGELALFLAGVDGLSLAGVFEDPDVPNPVGLAVDSAGGVYATTAGVSAAFAVVLGLGGSAGEGGPSGGGGVPGMGLAEEQLVLLQPFNAASLALIATLVSVSAEPAGDELGMEAEGEASGSVTAVASALPNQPLSRGGGAGLTGEGGAAAAEPEEPAGPAVAATVTRFVVGLDDALARARELVRQGSLFARVLSAAGGHPDRRAIDRLLARWSPAAAAVARPVAALALEAVRGGVAGVELVDRAIESWDGARYRSTPSAAGGPHELGAPGARSLADLTVVSVGLTALARTLGDTVRPPAQRPRRTPQSGRDTSTRS